MKKIIFYETGEYRPPMLGEWYFFGGKANLCTTDTNVWARSILKQQIVDDTLNQYQAASIHPFPILNEEQLILEELYHNVDTSFLVGAKDR